MKAAVLYKTGNPLVIEDNIDIPELYPEQVLVKIAFSGLCHSQLMEVKGYRGIDRYLPHMLGHEGSGIVVDIGKKVTKIKKGDYVILGWIKGTGEDYTGGTKYKKDDKIINAGGVTTFSDYAVVSENRCVKLPEGIPLDIAVLFGCAIPTGAGIVVHEIQLSPKNTIAFFGLGGIGLSALMAAALFNCRTIIAIDINESKLELAKDFGATHLINASMENPVKTVREITNGRGADYSIEAAGTTQTIEQAFKAVRKNGGTAVFASHPKEGDLIKLDPFDLISGRRIIGTWGGSCKPDEDIPHFAKLYRDGSLPLEKLLTNQYSLENINQALEDLEHRKIARALIEINQKI